MPHACACQESHPPAPGPHGTGVGPLRPGMTVAEATALDPAAGAALCRLGLDHCCGAHLSLNQAAAAAGVPLETVLETLGRALGRRA